MRWLRIFRRRHTPSCAEVAALLADYLEGETDPRTTELIDQHQAACKDCRNFADSYRETPRLLREVGCEKMPEEFRQRLEDVILKRMREERDS